MTSIRCINSCTKFFKITNARYLGFKRYSDKSDINDENAPRRKKTPHINEVNYSDIIENVPPTYFEYPKPKIHVPPYSKSLLEEWHDDLRHYINYFKDPSKDKAFLRYGIPDHFDIIVIGGGYIGSALGYWLREKHREGQNILVIDKNLEEMPNYGCELEQIPAAAFLGNFRQQFSIRENIDLAKYSVDFFRRINEHLFIPKEPPIDLPYQPFGHLILSDENGQEMLKASHLLQSNLDIQNELLTPYQLSQRFSWLNTSDIKLACHGMENEGWIDPQALLLAMRCRAMRLGTIFLKAEAVEFIFTDERREFVGFGLDQYRPTNALTVKLPDGKYRTFEFGHCMLALGAETGTFAKEVLFLDERNPGLFSLEVPIERRKRYIFCFEAPEGGPELSSPMIVDQYGLFVKRIGVFDYLCGLAPIPEEEPSADNLDVDYDFFNKRVWPLLANRIPLFENIKLKYGWAYFKDYNTYDGSGIVGRLPAYHNIFMAAGFGEMGIPFSPAIGKALTELLFDGYFTTIDLNRFALRRILKDIYVDEKMLFA